MRAAIYARVSTQRQIQVQTIEQQLERLRAYVQQQGWELLERHVFRDDGFSGATLNRPALDQLRDQAAAGEVDRVVITAPDRLTRNYVYQQLLLEEFESHGCLVEFLDRPMSADPHDQLVLHIRGAVAEYERTLIRDRMRRGRLAKYKAGSLLPWTIPPYGYQVDPDCPCDPAKVSINPVEAAVVCEIYALYLEQNATLYQLIRHLHHLGIPSPSGKTYWNCSTLRQILTNPTYTGQVFAFRTQSVKAIKRHSALRPVGKHDKISKRTPQESWMLVAHVPAIVTQEQFDLVKTRLSQNRRFARRNNTAHSYLLRCLVSCQYCHNSCIGREVSPGYCYYICRGKRAWYHSSHPERCPSRHIPAQQLDLLVWNDLCEVISHPDLIAQALQQAQTGCFLPQDLLARRDNLRKARTALLNQLDRLTEAYLNAVIPLPEYQRRRADLEKKLNALQEQENSLSRQVDRQKELKQMTASISDFCNGIRSGLDAANFEQQRRLVELLIDQVVVSDSEVEIRYVIPTNQASLGSRFCHLRKDYFSRYRDPNISC
jgi:site-specific DNA recombinase